MVQKLVTLLDIEKDFVPLQLSNNIGALYQLESQLALKSPLVKTGPWGRWGHYHVDLKHPLSASDIKDTTFVLYQPFSFGGCWYATAKELSRKFGDIASKIKAEKGIAYPMTLLFYYDPFLE